MPRMTSVLDWLPALPPVSVSMGMKVTSIGMAENAASYLPKMVPVTMPDTISTSSQAIRFLASEKTPVFKYGFSEG